MTPWRVLFVVRFLMRPRGPRSETIFVAISTIRLLLVEDHLMVRQAIKEIVSWDPCLVVVGEAEDAATALALIPEVQPHVAIIDIRLKGSSNGISLTKGITRDHPEVNVLALSAYAWEQYVRGMLRAGAGGYLLKDASAPELTRAIYDVYRGERTLSIDTAKRIWV